jgi:hypothetical protein
MSPWSRCASPVKQQDSLHVFVVSRLLLANSYVAQATMESMQCCPSYSTRHPRVASRYVWLNLFSSAFAFPSSGISPGSSGGLQRFFMWHGICVVCSKSLEWTQGLFCANFGRIATECVPCRRMWCPKCYTSSPLVMFHIAQREGEGIDPTGVNNDKDRMTSVWHQQSRDKNAFKRARKGDDIMVQFECDWCIFGKNYKRSPDPRHASDTSHGLHLMRHVGCILEQSK